MKTFLCWACSIHLACTANSNGLSGLESAGTSCSRCPVVAPGWTGHFFRVLLAHHKRSEHKKPGLSLFHVCPAHCKNPSVILKIRNQVLVAHPWYPSPVLQSSHHVLVRRGTKGFLCSAQDFFFSQKKFPESVPTSVVDHTASACSCLQFNAAVTYCAPCGWNPSILTARAASPSCLHSDSLGARLTDTSIST